MSYLAAYNRYLMGDFRPCVHEIIQDNWLCSSFSPFGQHLPDSPWVDHIMHWITLWMDHVVGNTIIVRNLIVLVVTTKDHSP